MAYGNFSRGELGEILTEFLCSVNFEMPQFDYDFSLEEPLMDYFRAQPWPEAQIDKAVKMAKRMSTGVGYAYPSVDKNIQVAYGIHVVYLFLVDDSAEELGNALDRFTTNLILGRRQESPVLQSLVDWLSESPIHLGSFAADMNVKGAIEHVRGCMLERDYDGKTIPPRGATNFPRYLRTKTGFAETYALFCFPEALYPESKFLQAYLPAIQDLCDYTNYTNDILSFYKESIVGTERLTYVPNIAHTHGLGLADALRKTIADVADHVQNIRVILADYPQLLKMAEEFIQGFIVWHLDQPRYRLGELTIRLADGKRYQTTTGFGGRESRE